MKRVLVISRNFPPLVGGMERLNFHMVEELSRRFQVCLIAPAGAEAHAPTKVLVTPISLRPLFRFLLGAGVRAVRQSLAWRPDIVVAGSGLTAPLALMAARCVGAKAIVYVHGLDLIVPHPVYKKIWLPVLRRFDGVIANSSVTAGFAREVGIEDQLISIVHPGVTIPEAVDNAVDVRFRDRYTLGSGPILLSVGRLAARKGLCEFVADVLPSIVESSPDTVFVIIGTAPQDALYAETQSPQSIQASADRAGVGKNIRFLGSVDNDTLKDAYVAADIHVFPIRHIPGDPEGFGMVAIEAASYGVPTVAYATGGVVDAVAEGISGRLIEPGNASAFAGATISLLEKRLCSEKIKAFASGFSWGGFGERLSCAMECCVNKSLEY